MGEAPRKQRISLELLIPKLFQLLRQRPQRPKQLIPILDEF
jgi:hypothetical protein